MTLITPKLMLAPWSGPNENETFSSFSNIIFNVPSPTVARADRSSSMFTDFFTGKVPKWTVIERVATGFCLDTYKLFVSLF